MIKSSLEAIIEIFKIFQYLWKFKQIQNSVTFSYVLGQKTIEIGV